MRLRPGWGNWRCSSGFEDIDDMWIEAIRAASHGEGGDISNMLGLFVAFFLVRCSCDEFLNLGNSRF